MEGRNLISKFSTPHGRFSAVSGGFLPPKQTVGGKFALTPALSPRRGSAETAAGAIECFAASGPSANTTERLELVFVTLHSSFVI